MANLKHISVILFFTDGISLKTWKGMGIFEREILLYNRLSASGIKYSFVTYGGGDETNYMRGLNDIGIIYNKHNLNKVLYKMIMPFLNIKTFLTADIFKTNQIQGSAYAVCLKKIFGKKLIARCGWMPSIFAQESRPSHEIEKNKKMEKYAFTNADAIVVPTDFMKTYVTKEYKIQLDKINTIPNYIDTDLFRPDSNTQKIRGRICTVGKNHPQKNYESLFEALKNISGLTLVIIGSAGKNNLLREKAKSYNLNVDFLENLPNDRLPQELNKSELFILPSLYEGHPKVLLEAMACGLPVIGTNVEGINNIIRHKENGYLCGTSPVAIENAIQEVMNDESLKRDIGINAKKYVVGNCSLERVLQMEVMLYKKLLA